MTKDIGQIVYVVMDDTDANNGILEAVFTTLAKANEYIINCTTAPSDRYSIYQCPLDAIDAVEWVSPST